MTADLSSGKHKSRVLIVEGYDDLRSVIGLMEHHVDWPNDKESAPVWIETAGSVEKVLQRGYLTAQLKSANREAVGIILDADLDQDARYQQLKSRCSVLFPSLPDAIPSEGLIAVNGDGLRLGVWIMPDNIAPGILETFLEHLVPESAKQLWDHGVSSVQQAMQMGAQCTDCQLPRAHLYTFLAWQDPPNQSPGVSLSKKILNPNSPKAYLFANWFKTLFGLSSLVDSQHEPAP